MTEVIFSARHRRFTSNLVTRRRPKARFRQRHQRVSARSSLVTSKCWISHYAQRVAPLSSLVTAAPVPPLFARNLGAARATPALDSHAEDPENNPDFPASAANVVDWLSYSPGGIAVPDSTSASNESVDAHKTASGNQGIDGAYSFSQGQDPPGSHHAEDPVCAGLRRPKRAVSHHRYWVDDAGTGFVNAIPAPLKTDHDEAGFVITLRRNQRSRCRGNPGHDQPE